MGWTPVNKVSIERTFCPHEIVVRWHDDMFGDKEKKFGFHEDAEALAFALDKFKSLCM